MWDLSDLRRLLEEMGLQPTELDGGRLRVHHNGLALYLRIRGSVVEQGTTIEVRGYRFGTVLVAVNAMSREFIAPQAWVKEVGDRVHVHYGLDRVPTSWPMGILRQRIAWFNNMSAAHASGVRGLLATPDPLGNPLRGFVGVDGAKLVCPLGHVSVVPAPRVTLSSRLDGSSDARWRCLRCARTCRRTLRPAAAASLGARGAASALTAYEAEWFAVELAAEDDVLARLVSRG